MTYSDFQLIIEYIALCFCILLAFGVTLFSLFVLIRLFTKDKEFNDWKKDKNK